MKHTVCAGFSFSSPLSLPIIKQESFAGMSVMPAGGGMITPELLTISFFPGMQEKWKTGKMRRKNELFIFWQNW
jgi:hypothetical protein